MAKRQISPGNAHPPPRLCPPHIRPCLPCSYRTLKILDFSSGMTASYAVSVRRASDLPAASFRFHLAVDTLAVQLTVPAAGPVGDFNPQVGAPCRAHQINPRSHYGFGGFAFINYFRMSPRKAWLGDTKFFTSSFFRSPRPFRSGRRAQDPRLILFRYKNTSLI